MNGKRYFLCIRRKWKTCILAILLGAIVCAGIYEVVFWIQTKQKMYEAEALYYVEVDDQKSYNYYNSYTWNTVVQSDPIIDRAMNVVQTVDCLPVTREEMISSFEADIASDLRYLTVKVTTDSKEKTSTILGALSYGLELFHGDVAEISAITTWSVTEPKLVVHENLVMHAAVLGLFIGLILWIVISSVYYALEDSIYVIADVKEYTEIPVLGIRCKKENEVLSKMLESTLLSLKKEANEKAESMENNEFVELSVEKEDTWNMDALQDRSVIITVSFGNRNGKKLNLLLNQLTNHHIDLMGVIITDADNRFIKDYYQV